mgnify:CR=1 FL=1
MGNIRHKFLTHIIQFFLFCDILQHYHQTFDLAFFIVIRREVGIDELLAYRERYLLGRFIAHIQIYTGVDIIFTDKLRKGHIHFFHIQHICRCGIGQHQVAVLIEGDNAVTGVAVQLGSCGLVLGEAVVQGVVGDVGQTHGIPEGLLQVLIDALAGDLLDHEAQQHVVDVGVDGLCAGSVDQRSGDDLSLGGLAVLGEQLVGDALLRQLGQLVELVVVVLGIGIEAGLMLQDVLDGQGLLPSHDLGLLLLGGAGLEDGGGSELGEELDDLVGDLHLAVGNQLLQSVVDGVHLGVGSQVVQGLVGDGHVVGILLGDAGAIGVVGVGSAPGVGLDQDAVLDDGHLSGGEAVLNVVGDDAVDHLEDRLVDADLISSALDDLGVVDQEQDGGAGSTVAGVGDLDQVTAVDGVVGDIDLEDTGLVQHGGGVDLVAVDEDTQAGVSGVQGDVDGALALKALEPVGGAQVAIIL